MGLFDRIKNFFKRTFSGGSSGGGGGSSGRGGSTSYDRASRVSNYGGGGGRSYNDYSSGGYEHEYQSYQRRRELERQERKRKQQATTNALASISKRTDALSSGRSSSTASSAASTGTTRVLARIGQKATPPDPKERARQTSQQRATAQLKKIADKVESDRKSYNKATGNRYNSEVGTKEQRARARQRIKSGEYQSDPKAAKWEYTAHPKSTMAVRTAANAMAFGVPDVAMKRLEKYSSPEMREAEDIYRKNQEEHPWIRGGAELAGSLIGFGGTAGMTERAGAKLVSKVAPNAAGRLAERKVIQKAAQRSVNKAIKKGVIKESSEELVKRVGKEKAAKIVNALGNDIVQNFTTGAVYDIANATRDYEPLSADWWKELGKSAAFNAVVAGGVAGGSMLSGGKRLAVEASEQLGKERGFRQAMQETFVKDGDKVSKRVDMDSLLERNLKEKSDALSPISRSSKAENMEQMRQSMREAFVREGDESRRIDFNNLLAQNSPLRQADEAVRPPAVESVADNVRRANEAFEFPDVETYIRELDERGEQWLGQHGHITANEDGTYNLFVNGVGDRTLTRDEAVDYITRARDALQEEEIARAERERVTRTTPLNEAENARIAEIDNEVERLRQEGLDDANQLKANKYKGTEGYWERQGERSRRERKLANEKETIIRKEPPVADEFPYEGTAEADDLRQQYIDRRNELQEEWDKWERGESNLTPYEIEEMGDELDRLDEQIKATEASEPPRRTETQPAPEAVAEPPRAEPQRETPPRAETVEPPQPKAVDSIEPKVEPPKADAKAETKVPKTKEEAIQMARESQTRDESEKLLRDYFDVNDEVDLGNYGKVSKNADGTYTLKIDGLDREATLTKAQVEERIRETTKDAYAEPRKVNKIEDLVNKEKTRETPRERINRFFKSLSTKMTDSYNAFEKDARELGKTDHSGMLKRYAAIDKARRYRAMGTRSLEDGQLNWNGDSIGKSLKDIYKGMDKETEVAFDSYLLAKHAPYRLLEGKPIFKNVEINGRKLDSVKVCQEEAERILKEHPEFEDLAEEIYRYNRNELQNRVDAGLLTKEVVDDWNKKYPYYVPTGRDGFYNGVHRDYGSTTGPEPIYAARGSDMDVRSIREQMEEATLRNWRDMTHNNLFRKMWGDEIGDELAKEADGGIEKVLDYTVTVAKGKEKGKYFADYYVGGEKVHREIDKDFFEAIQDAYKNGRMGNGFDTLNDALGKWAYVFKGLITEWNPIFMLKNPMRDLPEAIINSRQRKEFLMSMGDAFRDLKTNGPYSTALKNAGISQSTFVDLDKAILEEGNKNPLKTVGAKLAAGNEFAEMYTRLCEYMATFKRAGKTIEEADQELRDLAAFNAADVTVNFGRSGSFGKFLNRGYVPFFNASMQGWSKFIRNFTEQEDAASMLKFLATASALGAAPSTLSNFINEDNPNYQQISARDKATNYIIPIAPGKDRTLENTDLFIKIPRSRFASALGLPAVNAKNDNKMGWAEMLMVAKDQVAPIDPLDSHVLSVLGQSAANKTWYGTPIVPEGIKNETHPSEEYDANTSLLGKALGKATENLPKELQISPKKADYVLNQEFGVAADFALPALTPSRQGGGNAFDKYVKAPMGNVLKKQFTIDSTTQNDLSTRFYEQMQTAEDNKKSSKATDEDAAEYKRMNAYQKEISTLTAAMRDLQAGDRATKQEDIRGLQEVRNKMMQDALDGKKAPGSGKTLDAVQKYVGTTYAINNFGSSDDKEALKVYGAAVYGNLSEAEMQKKMDADKSFYTGVRAIINLEDKMTKAGATGKSSTLAKSVALASVGANDELFGAYKGANKSRTETENEMGRARTYMASGGSVDEFVQLERTRKTLGKLSDYDKEAELDNALSQLKSGEISQTEYYQKAGEIKYNANISYVGLATSLAQANAPARGYVLYDIKAKNIRKGINLAAMGFTARDYREMAKAVDADGNGYPKKQEIIDYVANSDVADKATLYDALYYYKSSRNPFGAVTNYSREQAAATGKANGVKAISNETGEIDLVDEEASTGYRRSGYRRRRGGYRRYGYSGGGSTAKATVPKPKTIKASDFKQGESLAGKSKSSSKAKVTPPKLKRVQAKIDLPTVR